MRKYFILAAMISSLFGCGPSHKTGQSQTSQDNGNRPITGSNQVTLTWASNRGEQQGFDIEESSDGTTFTQVLQVPDGTNTATITVPGVGQKYYFRIRGFNQAGTSPYTAIVTASQ